MTRRARLRPALIAVAFTVASLLGSSLFPGVAEAIVGRPLTPMSYAGVARRSTRRAVYYGAPHPVVVAPVVAAPVVAAPVVVAQPAVVW